MGVTILLYHALDSTDEPLRIENAADGSVVVEFKNFAEQLRCLDQMGKRIVALEKVLDSDSSLTDEECVILTFDDGHRSNWSLALPELLQVGAVATFYVVAGFVDRDPKYVSSVQLRELAAHGMLIGSHGMTHRYLPQLSPNEVRRELADSRTRLEDILGQGVVDFALPGGHSNRAVFEAIRECGYRSVATCKVGIHRLGDDPFHLPRLEIRRGLSLEGFRKTFNRSKLLQLQALEAAKMCLRQTCGLSGYIKLRRFAHRFLTLNR